MWIFTKDGFFSAVQKPEDRGHGTLTIRARVRQDIERFVDFVGNQSGNRPQVEETKLADYRYRVVVSASLWAQFVGQAAENIDYSNFKDASCKADHGRHDAYFRCWEALYQWQKTPHN